MKAGVLTALVCTVFSVFFLLTVGGQETRAAQDRAAAGWNRVLPLIKHGRLPSVLPDSNPTMLVVAIGASLLITAIIAGWTYRSATKDMARLETLRTQLAEITAAPPDLRQRIPVPDNNQCAVKYVVEMVNATLDLLEDCYSKSRRFTADASHDLRSPITAMRIHVEEALMDCDDVDWPRTAKTLLADLERLQAIVADLLTLARLDARVPTTREGTDLARLVGAELDRRTFQARVVRDLQPNVVIDCDRLQIIRLLDNLLDNAERHATTQITVIARADTATATLEVIDDGDGIPSEHRETVFDRFTRLDSARSRDAGGTGLGLAIARQIAEAHEGTMTIQDSPRGARFVLRIPARTLVPEH